MPRGENAISTCPTQTAMSCRLRGRSDETGKVSECKRLLTELELPTYNSSDALASWHRRCCLQSSERLEGPVSHARLHLVPASCGFCIVVPHLHRRRDFSRSTGVSALRN